MRRGPSASSPQLGELLYSWGEARRQQRANRRNALGGTAAYRIGFTETMINNLFPARHSRTSGRHRSEKGQRGQGGDRSSAPDTLSVAGRPLSQQASEPPSQPSIPVEITSSPTGSLASHAPLLVGAVHTPGRRDSLALSPSLGPLSPTACTSGPRRAVLRASPSMPSTEMHARSFKGGGSLSLRSSNSRDEEDSTTPPPELVPERRFTAPSKPRELMNDRHGYRLGSLHFAAQQTSQFRTENFHPRDMRRDLLMTADDDLYRCFCARLIELARHSPKKSFTSQAPLSDEELLDLGYTVATLRQELEGLTTDELEEFACTLAMRRSGRNTGASRTCIARPASADDHQELQRTLSRAYGVAQQQFDKLEGYNHKVCKSSPAGELTDEQLLALCNRKAQILSQPVLSVRPITAPREAEYHGPLPTPGTSAVTNKLYRSSLASGVTCRKDRIYTNPLKPNTAPPGARKGNPRPKTCTCGEAPILDLNDSHLALPTGDYCALSPAISPSPSPKCTDRKRIDAGGNFEYLLQNLKEERPLSSAMDRQSAPPEVEEVSPAIPRLTHGRRCMMCGRPEVSPPIAGNDRCCLGCSVLLRGSGRNRDLLIAKYHE
ncbi:hypothetical protein GMRT_10320 [Giardia muris]|uniref:Uncharacterized protein n=1 Tax=Giardia muris TaxID=5742 RepID=A0A4Z1SYP6_GIAMU|nr:hypothetical protein GMRT_10320 [Giardia muris]|eukprot:TNJ29895.1 hypothetical protein GMRT_10320 [Giardia muris]